MNVKKDENKPNLTGFLLQATITAAAIFIGFLCLYAACLISGSFEWRGARPFQDFGHLLREHAVAMRGSYVALALIPLLLVIALRGHKTEKSARYTTKYILPAIGHLTIVGASIAALEVFFVFERLTTLQIFLAALIVFGLTLMGGALTKVEDLAFDLTNIEGDIGSWLELVVGFTGIALILFYLPGLHDMRVPWLVAYK